MTGMFPSHPIGRVFNVRCGSKAISAPSSRRKGPPARDHAADALRKVLVARMKAAAAKTPTAQGGLTE